MTRADTHPPSTATELCLSLELARENDDALLRVVSILHRRRCRVLDASFRAGADAATDRLELRIRAPGAHAARVEHWLRGLIDVRSTSVI